MAHKVFICHSSHDKQVADAACAALEARRIPCWIAPRDILASDEWGKSIVEAIAASQIVLLIFSHEANISPQVRREIERAVSKGKVILPFRIEDILPSDAMEYALGNTHWLDAPTPPLEQHISQLVDTVARVLDRAVHPDPLWAEQTPNAESAPSAAPAPSVIPEPSQAPMPELSDIVPAPTKRRSQGEILLQWVTNGGLTEGRLKPVGKLAIAFVVSLVATGMLSYLPAKLHDLLHK